jgi:hypothetical protein
MNQTNTSTIGPDNLLVSPFGPDDLPVEAPMRPAICFPGIIKSSPENLILCTIYLLGLGSTIGVAIYLYLTGKRRNGQHYHRPSTV